MYFKLRGIVVSEHWKLTVWEVQSSRSQGEHVVANLCVPLWHMTQEWKVIERSTLASVAVVTHSVILRQNSKFRVVESHQSQIQNERQLTNVCMVVWFSDLIEILLPRTIWQSGVNLPCYTWSTMNHFWTVRGQRHAILHRRALPNQLFVNHVVDVSPLTQF